MAETPEKRDCDCKSDDEFCGECDICGEPGHYRHFPWPDIVYTSDWCDEHYDMLAREFGGGRLNDVPDTYYQVLHDEDEAKVYVACRGEWAVCFVVLKKDGREICHRIETLEWPDLWGIWFQPKTAWPQDLREISQSEFEAVCS